MAVWDALGGCFGVVVLALSALLACLNDSRAWTSVGHCCACCGGVVVDVVAHGAQLRGLHMTQVSFDELDAAEGECARGVPRGAIFTTDGDMGAGEGKDAGVARERHLEKRTVVPPVRAY